MNKKTNVSEAVEAEVKVEKKVKVAKVSVSPKGEVAAPAVAAVKVAKTPKAKKENTSNRTYATGRRKTSIARVWVSPGTGKFVINKKNFTEYLARPALQIMVTSPFKTTATDNTFDVMCTVKGGGLSGQAGAIRHGVSRALTAVDETLRPSLRKTKLLTRDSREVERKKYGQKKARKSFQFSKR